MLNKMRRGNLNSTLSVVCNSWQHLIVAVLIEKKGGEKEGAAKDNGRFI